MTPTCDEIDATLAIGEAALGAKDRGVKALLVEECLIRMCQQGMQGDVECILAHMEEAAQARGALQREPGDAARAARLMIAALAGSGTA